jgi:protein involved in polysaccharide export with SLBB domain
MRPFITTLLCALTAASAAAQGVRTIHESGGDVQDGDRIVVTVRTNALFRSDTVQLRDDGVLRLPGLPDLPLAGVPRAAIDSVVTAHVARFVRDPEVRVTQLLPIAVNGSVANPGYYYTTTDAVLRDVLMRAGGFRDGDINRIVIRRGGKVIIDKPTVTAALADGRSLEALQLHSGDEVYVPAARHFNWGNAIAVGASALAATVAIIQLSR